MRYREKLTYAGDFLYVDVYPVFKQSRCRRNKYRPTSEVQELLNQKHAERKLAALAHANFTVNDKALHLTYSKTNAPQDKVQAQKDIQNYIRRIKRRYSAVGVELKYIYATECSSKGKWHHHMIINSGISRDELEDCWCYGFTNCDRLQFDENGITDLTHYIQKERQFYRRWSASRNLKQPEEDTKVISTKEVNRIKEYVGRVPLNHRYAGYVIVEQTSDYNEYNRGTYVSLRLCRCDARLSFVSVPEFENEFYFVPKSKRTRRNE